VADLIGAALRQACREDSYVLFRRTRLHPAPRAVVARNLSGLTRPGQKVFARPGSFTAMVNPTFA